MSLMRPMLQSVLADTVTVPTGNNFSTFGTSGTVYSGVKFDADGNVYQRQSGGGWSSIGAWLVKGAAGSFYISRSIDAGSLTTDAGAGPLIMSTDRIYDVQQSTIGTKTAEVAFEISDDVSGSPIVAGPETYQFSAEKGSFA